MRDSAPTGTLAPSRRSGLLPALERLIRSRWEEWGLPGERPGSLQFIFMGRESRRPKVFFCIPEGWRRAVAVGKVGRRGRGTEPAGWTPPASWRRGSPAPCSRSPRRSATSGASRRSSARPRAPDAVFLPVPRLSNWVHRAHCWSPRRGQHYNAGSRGGVQRAHLFSHKSFCWVFALRSTLVF